MSNETLAKGALAIDIEEYYRCPVGNNNGELSRWNTVPLKAEVVRASIAFIAFIDLWALRAISLCLCVCHSYHIEGSFRVVHWRAYAGILFYRIL